jgi:hypothetical protein
VDPDITPFADAWGNLINADPVVASQARHRQYNSDQLEPLFANGMLIAMMNIRGLVAVASARTACGVVRCCLGG